jgi:hypothetical protein
MSILIHTTSVGAFVWRLRHIVTSQLSLKLCLRLSNLAINAILFFVSELPWFVQLGSISAILIIDHESIILTSLGCASVRRKLAQCNISRCRLRIWSRDQPMNLQ